MNNVSTQSLLATLNECVVSCQQCAAACLHEADVKMMVKCIQLDLDCAQICSTASSLIARGSLHGLHLLHECVEICNVCALECEHHAHMQHCKHCAEACRKCAAACHQMETVS